MHEHRTQVAERDPTGLGDAIALLQREVHTEAGHRREKRVRERAHDQPNRCGEQRIGHRLAVGDVEDVLQPGETHPDQAGVHQAVGQRVELVAAPTGQHKQQKQAFRGFLGQRRSQHDGNWADRLRIR